MPMPKLFMDESGRKYIAVAPKRPADCELPIYTQSMFKVLSDSELPMTDAEITSAIQTLKLIEKGEVA